MDEVLPPEIQKLLQHLEEKNQSDSQATESVISISLEELGREEGILKLYALVTGDNWMIFDIPGAKQSRLRVLRAIGSCKTLQTFNLRVGLASVELEALLTLLQSSSVLEVIDLYDPDPSTIESEEATTDHEEFSAAERVWTILGNILGTNCTLRELHMQFRILSDVVVQNLASALRGNSDSALEKLSVFRWERPSLAKHVAEIVLAAPKLSKLKLGETGELGDDDIKALSNAVVQKTSLETLGVGYVGRGGSALLLECLAGEGCNKSIIRLELHGNIDGLGHCLPIILSSNQTIKSVGLTDFDRANMSPTQSRELGHSLCSNTSLKRFSIYLQWSYIGLQAIDSLREILSGISMKTPIIKLQISTLYSLDTQEDLSGSSSVSDVVIRNMASLRSLGFELENGGWERVSEVENICEALKSNSSVRKLVISRARGRQWSNAWKKLFVSLRFNTTITHLNLEECDGLGEDEFKDLMGILQVNMTLKTIFLLGTSWEKDGKDALIEEALSRNAKQESYFSILGGSGAKLEFETAKAARLFLCGSPRAGKTRLRQTLTRLVRGRSRLGDKLAELLRTKGIEVEMLRDDEGMQIAMWDLGGQSIFRTLQDILFPRTNQAFLFLYVFSVYDEVKDCMKENLDESFKTELEEWLRFIASNVQITGLALPKMVVVISHMDKMEVRSTEWAEVIVEKLRVDFEEVLDLHSSEILYQMDARKKKEVAPLKDFIFDTFEEMLHNKAPIVPKVCSGLNSALGKRRKLFKHRPLWRSEDFYQFCLKSLKEDSIPFPTLEIHNESKVLEAMASYLHDTGSIIVIPNSGWIVVDPNWLTSVFLGELISIGQNFQVNDQALPTHEVAAFHSRDGFVSSFDLHELLSTFIVKHPKVKELNEKVVIDILIQLDLCYKVDGANVKYYIPTIVCEDSRVGGSLVGGERSSRSETLSWSSPPEKNQEFVGFRLQCENPIRMSMTAALFPRFQIHTRQKLMTEMDLTDDDVICSRYYLHLHMDGHEIFIERRDIMKSHIDVMVKCSKYKSAGTVLKYVKEHIIEGLQKFCASPKGCPGIRLVVGILQSKCVEKLVPWKYRGDKQAILVDNLVEKLEARISKHLEEIRLECWSESTSTLLNYEHSWPAIPGYLPKSFQLAKEILSETEVESATRKLLESYQHRLTTLDHTFQEMNQEVERAECVPKVISEFDRTSSSAVVEELHSSSSEMCVQIYERQSMARIDRMDHSLKKRIDQLGQRMEERFDDMAVTLRRIETNLDSIIVVQHQFQSLLRSFNSKVDEMIGYAESLEGSRTPKRPYLNFDNVSIFQKVMGIFRVGTPVRLHLMCESSKGPHIVKDQLALELCLAKENMEWLRSIYDISFKMMLYLVKAGLHVTLGLGDAVPNLGSVEATLPMLIASTAVDSFQIEQNTPSMDMSGNMPLNEAWNRLRNVLAPQLENQYTSLFNLYKVKYFNLQEGGYAWLCEQCMVNGVRNKSLECL